MEKENFILYGMRIKRPELYIGVMSALIPVLLLANLALERFEIARAYAPPIALGLFFGGIAAAIRAAPLEYQFSHNILVWTIIFAGLVAPLSLLPNAKESVFTYELAYSFGVMVFAVIIPPRWKNSRGKE